VTTLEQARVRESLVGLVGDGSVAAASPEDAIDGVQPALVVEPSSIDEAARVLGWANAAGLSVTPRGGSSRMGWGNVPRSAELVLSTRRLNRLVEHAAGDMTTSAECGLTLQALQQALGEAGQMLALDVPSADRATIGGLIATNDSGPLRLRYGGIRDLVLGVTLVRPDGVVVKGGGKVVKNVAGYDLPKLLTGSLGTLGLLVEATFRLHPLPAESRTLIVQPGDVQQAGALILKMLDSTLTPTGLTLRWSDRAGCDLSLRLSGIGPSVEAQVEQAGNLMAQHRLDPELLDAAEADAAWRDLGTEPWSGDSEAIVARCSVLPTEIPALLLALRGAATTRGLQASAVVQAHGLGLIRLQAPEAGTAMDEALLAAVDEIREGIAGHDGTLVLLSAPLSVKRRLDVWGPAPDSLPLMRRVKAQFDPKGTLNPGRFIGGI
jgi:glycolate oxidase FAD binding subunit